MAFMVGLSEASMGSLLQKLGVLLAREYALIRGINGDIQEINDELSSMQAFLVLLDKEGSNELDMGLKNWVRQVRDATYDIEDTVDEFTHRIGRRQRRRGDGFFSSVVTRLKELATWYPRRNIVLDIKELNARAQRISERRIRYGVVNGGTSLERAYEWLDDEIQQGVLVRQLVGVKDPVARWHGRHHGGARRLAFGRREAARGACPGGHQRRREDHTSHGSLQELPGSV